MAYYICQLSGAPAQIWKIDDAVAVRLGVPNPESAPWLYFKAEPGETVWDTMRRQVPFWFEPPNKQPFHETILGLGQFYPRIARPSAHHPADFPRIPMMTRRTDADLVAIARSQLTALMRQLELICQTVHPSGDTFNAFGHSIRNLLILACTEVEAHWRGILVANNFKKAQYNTHHYVLLQTAMRLGDYAIEFPSFPWLGPFCPFDSWGKSGKPTQELGWYAAYNAVKHDRENQFSRATLRNIFEAVSACVIMMVAQFGSMVGLGRHTELASFFHLSSWPRWPLSHVYLTPFGPTSDGQQVNYPFDAPPS
jgi:hypothetical protein